MSTASWLCNEKTTLFLRIAFLDQDGDPTTPEHAWYRIDDVRSGTRIVPAAVSPVPVPTADPDGMIPLTPVASVIDLQITSAQNDRVAQTGPAEERIVSVEFTYDTVGGVSKRGTTEYHYWVKALPHIS